MYKLCQCNNCGTIMYDGNPRANQRGYTQSDIDSCKKLQNIKDMAMIRDGGAYYWGCPECNTDQYLRDYEYDIERAVMVHYVLKSKNISPKKDIDKFIEKSTSVTAEEFCEILNSNAINISLYDFIII